MANKLNILKYYMLFKNKKFSNREILEEYQQNRIKKHLKFVTTQSEYYEKYKDVDLSKFPIMNKKLMMDNFDKLNTVNIQKNKALEFAIEAEKERNFKPRINNITIGLSSGTSNTRGIFLLSDTEIEKWAGFILARIIPGELLKKHKIAFFMRANSNLYESVGSGKIKFKFFDIYKPIEENIKELNNFNPDIIVGQPSVLKEISTASSNNVISINPSKVISIAEVLEHQDEEIIKKAFKLTKVDQVYQCTEGCLAVTCQCGNIHLNEDIVYFEKEYLDDKRFIPVLTDFSRTSQPIIRYRLNDILVESKEKCGCGSCFTVIEKIEGREDDVFIFYKQNGEIVKIFPDFIRRCILFSGDIDNYRILQEENLKINVYVDCNEELKNKIVENFKKLSKDYNFKFPEISFYSYTYDKSKKLKRVESLVRM